MVPSARVRAAAGVLIFASFAALLFTLTRGAWIAGVLASLLAMALLPRFRPLIPTIVGSAAIAVVALFALVPSINDQVTARADDLSPVWERQNTNAAAVRIVTSHPAFGVGWFRYVAVGDEYLRQPDDIPLRGAGVIVHNVFLLTLAELGIVGALLWFGAIAICVVIPALRRGPPARRPWRAATLAMVTCCMIAGLFAPQFTPYPAVLIWVFGGISARSVFESDDSEPRAATEDFPAHETL